MLVLQSNHSNYRLWVRQPTEMHTPNGDKWVKEKGVCLIFEKGKCFVKDPEVIKAFYENHAIQRLLSTNNGELQVLNADLFQASGEGYKLVDPRLKVESFACGECKAVFATAKKMQMHQVGKHLKAAKKVKGESVAA